MQQLATINDLLERFASALAIGAMAIIAVVLPYEALGRYFIGTIPIWSGEISIYSLVWISMFGGAVGLRRGYQIGMTFVLDHLPFSVARILRIASGAATLALLAILVRYGTQQVIVNTRQISPAMGIPMAIPYLAIPLGAFIMMFFSIERLLLDLRGAAPLQQQQIQQ